MPRRGKRGALVEGVGVDELFGGLNTLNPPGAAEDEIAGSEAAEDCACVAFGNRKEGAADVVEDEVLVDGCPPKLNRP